jgi:hypothetical protein
VDHVRRGAPADGAGFAGDVEVCQPQQDGIEDEGKYPAGHVPGPDRLRTDMPDAEHDGGVDHALPGAVRKDAHVHAAPQDLVQDTPDKWGV